MFHGNISEQKKVLKRFEYNMDKRSEYEEMNKSENVEEE